MGREKYIKEMSIIKDGVRNILSLAGKELGDYFITKGFTHVLAKEYMFEKELFDCYYDKNTRIGFRIVVREPDNIYDTLPVMIIYYLDNNQFCGVFGSEIRFSFLKSESESVFKRFKTNYMNNRYIKAMKINIRERHPKRMSILDRKKKLEEINKKAKD